MEWIVEGMTLIFLGILTIVVTKTDTESKLAKSVFTLIIVIVDLSDPVFEPGTTEIRVQWQPRLDLLLDERRVAPDPRLAAEILARELLARELDERNRAWLRRLRFAGIEVEIEPLVAQACAGRTTLPELDLGRALSPDIRRRLDRLAPAELAVPSGRSVRPTTAR